jgi:gamma-glutamylcyclotransferase (GGCT)/AIG2-like uncharacterized protein YtfP
MSIYVFVYGTLRAGEINDLTRLAARHSLPTPTLLGAATAPGVLVDFGHYPGLIPTNCGRRIRGELYQVTPALLALIDKVEGYVANQPSGFIRSHTVAQTNTGTQACQYYPIDPSCRLQAITIDGDDWVAYRKARAAQILK